MRTATMLLALAVSPAIAQIAKAVPAARPAAPPAAGGTPTASRQLRDLEKRFDESLATAGGLDHIDLRGFTRGLNLAGYGAVFTAEVDLIVSPSPNPFRQAIGPEEAAKVHQRKLANFQLLKKVMQEMMASSAKSLDSLQAPNDQIVVAVRLWYQSWEDTSGLPSQIVMKADRKSALAGAVKTELQ